MVLQLEERMRLKHALDLAMEVQQNLLPQKSLKLDGVDIAGESIYCEETGGDYYDFLQFSELGQGRVGIAVGDVVGHGIAAALLMATVRAFLRIRVTQRGSLSEMIIDVNRLLCIDTAQTGSFMTLFFMTIDSVKRDIQWVRAGHDPAIVYNPSMGSFSELGGSGIALGIDDSWSFQEYTHSGWSNGEIILIGTDGIWETQSPQDGAYGKDRLRHVIRQRSKSSSQEIVLAITDDVAAFRQSALQNDDITLVVVKTEP
jgi:sigma-B regulation protein RsbU (phosphoserine phosphatase)